MQLGILVSDIATEFNWVLVFVALVPLLFFFKMQKRERSWITGLVAIYLCIGVLLMVLMNTSSDRQSAELNKVFFIASHGDDCDHGRLWHGADCLVHGHALRSGSVASALGLDFGVSNTLYGGAVRCLC